MPEAHTESQQERIAQQEAEIARLRATLRDADQRLFEHHEAGHIARMYEQHLGVCPICNVSDERPQIFERISSTLVGASVGEMERKAKAFDWLEQFADNFGEVQICSYNRMGMRRLFAVRSDDRLLYESEVLLEAVEAAARKEQR